MTNFQILILIAVLLIVAGVVLLVATVMMFYRQNMASVYDALYNRGYTQRIEARRQKKKAKDAELANPAVGGAKDAWTKKDMEDINSGGRKKTGTGQTPTPSITPTPPQPAPAPAPAPAPQPEPEKFNSGETTMLDNAPGNMANSGETTLLGEDDYPAQANGETTLLDADGGDDDFVILRAEQFTDSDEII